MAKAVYNYKRYKPAEPDKTAIKRAIKSGITVPGAELVEKRNLQIVRVRVLYRSVQLYSSPPSCRKQSAMPPSFSLTVPGAELVEKRNLQIK